MNEFISIDMYSLVCICVHQIFAKCCMHVFHQRSFNVTMVQQQNKWWSWPVLWQPQNPCSYVIWTLANWLALTVLFCYCLQLYLSVSGKSVGDVAMRPLRSCHNLAFQIWGLYNAVLWYHWKGRSCVWVGSKVNINTWHMVVS